METTRLIYLASPYSAPVLDLESPHRPWRARPATEDDKNRRAAQVRHVMAELMLVPGNVVFCPIAHTHEVGLEHLSDEDHNFWMGQDITILRRCDELHVLMLDQWHDSKGVAEEIEVARDIGLPIHYITPGDPHHAEWIEEGLKKEAPRVFGTVNMVAEEHEAYRQAMHGYGKGFIAQRSSAKTAEEIEEDLTPKVRAFESGATRSADSTRDDPEGYISPIVQERFCHYMTKHRVQPDGSVRDSDNWQKGMPLATYMKGLIRHVQHAWTRHRGYTVMDDKAAADLEEDLCAIRFNADGYLHELLKNAK